MKIKNLRKKIEQLEKRLREGPKKLAKLKQRLRAGEAAKAMKARRKSAARATGSSLSTAAKTPSSPKKTKKKLNLSPERRAQLSAAMKARWAAKRAGQANAKSDSTGQDSAQRPPPQASETRPDGA